MRKGKSSGLPGQLQHVNLNAAGIDVGSEFHFVAVGPDRDPQPVRKFGGYTADLATLAQWLKQCRIETVVMESTGIYWIPLFEFLECSGFEVLLVDSRRLKHVPGRKSDVLDCQWLQELHTFGLLSPAYRPPNDIVVLRSYVRQRAMLVQEAAKHIQHMQKALRQMNLLLDKVISDVTGKTGMAIIKAILAGERNPHELAKLRDPNCKNSTEKIAKALEGNWREEHLFALGQAVTLYETYLQHASDCDQRIERQLKTFEDRSDGETPAEKSGRRRPHGLTFDGRKLILRATGADLTAIDGIDTGTALKIVSEVGTDLSAFPTVKQFTSWLGLCPGIKQSGGKLLSARTRASANRLAQALRMAACSLCSSHTALGAFFRRLRARTGPRIAVTATAHKLAKLIYYTLKKGMRYDDPGENWYESQFQKRMIKSIKRRAKDLGYMLVPVEPKPQPAGI